MAGRALPEIMADLAGATQSLVEARGREDEARREATSALNVVNRLQAELDAALVALKKSAPRETDWARRPGVPCDG